MLDIKGGTNMLAAKDVQHVSTSRQEARDGKVFKKCTGKKMMTATPDHRDDHASVANPGQKGGSTGGIWINKSRNPTKNMTFII